MKEMLIPCRGVQNVLTRHVTGVPTVLRHHATPPPRTMQPQQRGARHQRGTVRAIKGLFLKSVPPKEQSASSKVFQVFQVFHQRNHARLLHRHCGCTALPSVPMILVSTLPGQLGTTSAGRDSACTGQACPVRAWGRWYALPPIRSPYETSRCNIWVQHLDATSSVQHLGATSRCNIWVQHLDATSRCNM
jgi:hypothetical protein